MSNADDRFLVNPFDDENFKKIVDSSSATTQSTNEIVDSFLSVSKDSIRNWYGEKFYYGERLLQDASLPIEAKRKYFLDVVTYYTASYPPDALYHAMLTKVVGVACIISPTLKDIINRPSGLLSKMRGEFETAEEWLAKTDVSIIPDWVSRMLDYVGETPELHQILENFIETLTGFSNGGVDASDIIASEMQAFDDEMDETLWNNPHMEMMDMTIFDDMEEIDPSDLNLDQDEDGVDDEETP